MKIAILPLTSGGKKLAEKIVEAADDAHLLQKKQTVAETLKENWPLFDGLVCIMAAGIVVRAIAPLLHDKGSDPCVLVMDEKGRHVISLLSGHLGGGNQLAEEIAKLTDGTAVITTASDTLNLVALDIWAREQDLAVEDRNTFTKASSQLVNNGSLKLFCDVEVESLPVGLILAHRRDDAELIITNKKAVGVDEKIPVLHPRNLVVGVGCNRGTPVHEFEEALAELFEELGLARYSIRNLASIDVKNNEVGLVDFAKNNSWPITFHRREEINTVEKDVTISRAALKAVGAIGVAEPTALLSANTNILLSRKRKWQNITMAVAEAPFTLSAQDRAHSST
jgi:cobalt-precorrin 5A hydrolase